MLERNRKIPGGACALTLKSNNPQRCEKTFMSLSMNSTGFRRPFMPSISLWCHESCSIIHDDLYWPSQMLFVYLCQLFRLATAGEYDAPGVEALFADVDGEKTRELDKVAFELFQTMQVNKWRYLWLSLSRAFSLPVFLSGCLTGCPSLSIYISQYVRGVYETKRLVHLVCCRRCIVVFWRGARAASLPKSL